MPRRSHGLLFAPAFFKAANHSTPPKAETPAPLGKAKPKPVVFDVTVLGGVLELFSARGPLAIVRRIATVIVDSFQGQSWRLRTHVGPEVVEVAPPFADCDATSTVAAEVLMGGLEAPGHHLFPDAVLLRASAKRRGAAVGLRASAYELAAPATLGVALDQAAARNVGNRAAVAQALPDDSRRRVIASDFLGDKSAESEPGQIDGMSRYSVASHAVSSLIGDGVVRGCRALATSVSLAFNYPTQLSVWRAA